MLVIMLFCVNNLSRTLFRKSKEKCRYLRNYSYKNSYKLLFFGSDSIAFSSFKKVNEFRKSGKAIDRLDLVITNKAKNKSEIEKYAQSENITTKLWPLQDLQAAEYDLGLIVAFGHLIKDDLLNKFPLYLHYQKPVFRGMVNVHPSLLPRWRGAAPIIHTLMHGDQITGVSLMKIQANVFDVGAIISQRKVAVSKDVMQPELTEQLSGIGAEMLVDCLRTLPKSIENAQPQSTEGVTYAKKINKNLSEVQWSAMTAAEVYNLHRALYGIHSLATKFNDRQMKLFNAFLVDQSQTNVQQSPGTIEYCDSNKSIKVLCKDKKYVHFRSLRIVGKREISALDFYNGYIKNIPVEKRKSLVFRN